MFFDVAFLGDNTSFPWPCLDPQSDIIGFTDVVPENRECFVSPGWSWLSFNEAHPLILTDFDENAVRSFDFYGSHRLGMLEVNHPRIVHDYVSEAAFLDDLEAHFLIVLRFHWWFFLVTARGKTFGDATSPSSNSF